MSQEPETVEEPESEQEPERIHPDDEWMSLKDATAYTKIKRGSLYHLMKEGLLPWYRVIGTSQRRLKRSDLDRLMVRGDSDDETPDEEEPDA